MWGQRTVHRVLTATGAGFVAGVAALLLLAAVVDAYGDLGAAVLIATAAVWISQGVRPLLTMSSGGCRHARPQHQHP